MGRYLGGSSTNAALCEWLDLNSNWCICWLPRIADSFHKVYLLILLLWLMVLRCNLPHLIRQSCFLKSFLRPLLLLMVKNTRNDCDSSRGSVPDYNLEQILIVLRNWHGLKRLGYSSWFKIWIIVKTLPYQSFL